MTSESEARFEAARQAAPAYARAAAVIVAGSTARGHADRFSDLEIGVFWHEAPGDETRLDAIAAAGGEVVRLYPLDETELAWYDDWRLDGFVVDLVHMTVADAERMLDDVVARHDPDDLKLNLVAAIVDGVPLHGHGLLASWRGRAVPLPAELTQAIVGAHAQIDHFWRFEALVERRNPLLARRFATEIVERLLRVLLALNGVYPFGFKWLDEVTARLTLAPSQLADRLRAVLLEPPERTAALLAPLVEETYDLIEANVDGVDVGRLREIFRYRRPPT
jgi:hypothetical protein